MKMNPQKVKALVNQGSRNLVTKSRDLLRRFDPEAPQDATDLTIYDASILQQGRFWMRSVTWAVNWKIIDSRVRRFDFFQPVCRPDFFHLFSANVCKISDFFFKQFWK